MKERKIYIKNKKKASIIFMIVGLLLMISSFLFIYWYLKNVNIWFIIGFFTFIGLGMLLVKISLKFMEITCMKCGLSMYGSNYSYELLYQHDNKNRDGKKTNRMQLVRIRCTCPSCGKEKRFNKDFRVKNYSNNNTYNVETYIKDYCNKNYGQNN